LAFFLDREKLREIPSLAVRALPIFSEYDGGTIALVYGKQMNKNI